MTDQKGDVVLEQLGKTAETAVRVFLGIDTQIPGGGLLFALIQTVKQAVCLFRSSAATCVVVTYPSLWGMSSPAKLPLAMALSLS